MSDRVAPQLKPWRLGASMFTAFGVLALCLAAVGLYGLLSYIVTQRTQEIGIRKALGAPSGGVVSMVLRGALGMTVVGVAIGVVAALAARTADRESTLRRFAARSDGDSRLRRDARRRRDCRELRASDSRDARRSDGGVASGVVSARSRAVIQGSEGSARPAKCRSLAALGMTGDGLRDDEGLRLVSRAAAHDGAYDLNVFDLVRAHRVRIVGQHDEVRQLARRDRALERFLMRGVRAVDRVDLDRLVDADALIGAPRRAVPTSTRHHALNAHQRRERARD